MVSPFAANEADECPAVGPAAPKDDDVLWPVAFIDVEPAQHRPAELACPRRLRVHRGLFAERPFASVAKARIQPGFNAQTEEYEDLLAAGVLDPTKVVRSSLQNAASVAALFLTTQALVAEKPEAKKGGGMPDMGGMGGMGDIM